MNRLKKAIGGTWDWLRNFFSSYFWLGVVMLLLSIIVDLICPAVERTFSQSLILEIFKSVGVAILIAAIFSYASSTSQFVEKIQKLLEDIVVKRNFLGNIDPEGKKEALKSLIQPSAAEKNKYPNIGDYYGYFINKTLEIGKKSVRSNYQITSRAYFDPAQKRIAVEGMYSYRLYPSTDGFHDITVGFEEPQGGPSYCHHVVVSTPDGKRVPFNKPPLVEDHNGGDITSKATIPIKEVGKDNNHVDVELKLTEYGKDHWALITFKALQPTDGFRFHLRCEDSVKIQKHAIFVVGAAYFVEADEDGKSITIGCNQWINEGSGLSVLVSIPHESVSVSG